LLLRPVMDPPAPSKGVVLGSTPGRVEKLSLLSGSP
jgi:hypothetical protein